MSLIRRSHFPSFLFSKPAPAKAPPHPAVQGWLKSELHTSRHPKPLKDLARLMEKALDRQSLKLDLSSADPMALHKVPPHLMQRLHDHVAHLVLPDSCPPDVVAHWAQEMPNVEITPTSIVPERSRLFQPQPPRRGSSKLREDPLRTGTASTESVKNLAMIAGGRGFGRPARAPMKVDAPTVPASESPLSSLPLPSALPGADKIREALDASRPMRAWLLNSAFQQGNGAKAALGHEAANAIAEALLVRPDHLPHHLEKAFAASQAVLAARSPGKDLHLSADQAHFLDIALSAIESRSAASTPSTRQESGPVPPSRS